MGSSYRISCNECNYTKSFSIGIGMMYDPQNMRDLESKFALLPSLIQSDITFAHIKKLLNERDAVIAYDYGHEIYHCPKCGEFYGRFFIHLDYDGGSFEVEYKCPNCKVNIEPINDEGEESDGGVGKGINLQKYPCPQCGKHSLYEDRDAMILWD